MRCQCVGANVSPMREMLSPAKMSIKPAVLPYTTHPVPVRPRQLPVWELRWSNGAPEGFPTVRPGSGSLLYRCGVRTSNEIDAFIAAAAWSWWRRMTRDESGIEKPPVL